MALVDLFEQRPLQTPRVNSDWSHDRIEMLCELYPQGSASWIAREINRLTGSAFTRNAIIGKAHRLKLIAPDEAPETYHTVERKPRKITHKRKPRKRAIAGFSRNGPSLEPTFFEETVQPADFLSVPFADLKINDHRCRYPRGEGSHMLFCGQPVKEGSSYCGYCHSIAYLKADTPKRTKTRFEYLSRFS